jgi:hypothetical protein
VDFIEWEKMLGIDQKRKRESRHINRKRDVTIKRNEHRADLTNTTRKIKEVSKAITNLSQKWLMDHIINGAKKTSLYLSADAA